MSELPVKSEPISEVDRLRQEITDLINSGIVEVAARNPNVLEYMRHWEGRAETAEAAIAAFDARIAELGAEVESLRAGPRVKPLEWDDGPNNSMASAETIFGAEYRAYLRRDGTWQLHLPPANLLGDFPSREAFKAAAQADYEAWILSALVQP